MQKLRKVDGTTAGYMYYQASVILTVFLDSCCTMALQILSPASTNKSIRTHAEYMTTCIVWMKFCQNILSNRGVIAI